MDLTRQQKTMKNLDLAYGRSSEMLILSSGISETCVIDSNHETMVSLLTVLYLATTAPVSRSLGALHAEHSLGIQSKLIYGYVFALVLLLSIFLPPFISV